MDIGTDGSTADYIVVGGGSAGCVLASRLTEDRSISVVLVEAGSDARPDKVRNPAAWPTLIGSDVDWGFSTEPQTALDDRVVAYPRGRILGGSSATNGLMHMRALPANLAAWVASGATEWSYEALLPAMDRVDGIGRDGDDAHIHLGATPTTEIASMVMRAMQETPELERVQMEPNALKDGERDSAADAYLDATVRARPNLTVMADTTALRVVFEGDRAVGVEVEGGEGTTLLTAGREVVLTAGAIGSPQLLMVSGIGPADQLQEFGIDVLVDSPEVGQGLQDHPQAGVTWETPEALPSMIAGGKLIGLMRSDPAAAAPDLQFLFVGVPYHPRTLPTQPHGFTIAVSVLLPDSRGSVRLSGDSVHSTPHIDPRFLSTPRDLARMVLGLRVAREIIGRAGLAAWQIREALPGADVTDDHGLQEFARVATSSYYHPVGTCRLGEDERSVVDQHLRVRGVTNLRVVDASVMPSIVSANTNATVYAIAEHAAELIRRS